jgi:predicted CXXCH cytochrome family protein
MFMKRKKLLSWSLAMVISFLLWGEGIGYAKVTGRCDNCHTMHNSQGGSPMRTDGPEPLSTPLAALLLNDCLGCHTTIGGYPFVDGYPFVKLSGATDSNCLAGGFFQTIAVPGDNNGNQNHDIGATAVPAGFDSDENSWYTGHTAGGGDGLGCAGTNGCHGNETDLDDMAAISGGHHAPSAYRILYVGTDTVCGSPAEDYEEGIINSPSTTVVYSGTGQNVNIYSADTVGVTEATISELCGKCHGVFHGENTGSDTDGTKNIAGEWIRHPSDEELPTGWTMGGVYAFDGDDAKNNPFGYTNAVYAANPTQVTCLSCHRAHGTANADLLRWAYSTQSAGTSTADYGCLGCHDRQR